MTPATGNPRKFHKGPPPFPSWWLTSVLPDGHYWWRWWNGKAWSTGISERMTPAQAKIYAFVSAVAYSDQILWSDYWPANARVPRINPNKETA